MDFKELAMSRHSAIKFEPGVEISTEELNNIFELTRLSPTAYNLQHAEFLVIRDQERKEKVKSLSYNQYKIGVSSAVVFVLGDKKAYQNVEKIYGGMKMLKMIDELEFDSIVSSVHQMHEGNERFQEEEAIRNASITAMTFMYAAKHYGWDTCPMHSHNHEELRKEFNIPENLEPIMMITLGKSVQDRERPRGYRKPLGELVKFENY